MALSLFKTIGRILHGKMGRKEFSTLFLCALAAVVVFTGLLYLVWLVKYGIDDYYFNRVLIECMITGCFCLITGLIPLAILVLLYYTLSCTGLGYAIGYEFFALAILIDALYVYYIILCGRRCRDMGRSWLLCLIPFYNPFVLLFGKSKAEDEHRVRQKDISLPENEI